MKTAEWICSSCGTVNRQLVHPELNEIVDRCITCRTEHRVSVSDRPVRWNATAK